MSDTNQAPSRVRPSRAQADAQERTRRRRFGEDDEGVDFNLWVDKSALDPTYQYRWVNDQRGRIKKLEGQDWDLVAEADVNFPTDRHADIAAGKSEDMRTRLMRKPRDWFNDDHKRKQQRIDDQMAAAARGEQVLQERGQKGENLGGLSAQNAYKPNGTNTL